MKWRTIRVPNRSGLWSRARLKVASSTAAANHSRRFDPSPKLISGLTSNSRRLKFLARELEVPVVRRGGVVGRAVVDPGHGVADVDGDRARPEAEVLDRDRVRRRDLDLRLPVLRLLLDVRVLRQESLGRQEGREGSFRRLLSRPAHPAHPPFRATIHHEDTKEETRGNI